MTCEQCSEEAMVHHAEIVDGKRVEIHLCLKCAKAAGLALPEMPPSLPLDEVVKSLIVAHVGELVGELAKTTCHECGVTYMGFRGLGRLGCPNDYAAFSRGLMSMIGQYHGATRHVGKRPRRQTVPCDRARLRLRNKLRDAIEAEDYEAAARFRDELRPKDADR